MFHVDQAALVPGQCTFTKSHVGPFIDFGRDFEYDHVGRIYVKESFAREMGVFAGLPSLEERDGLVAQLEAANASLEQLRALVADKDARIGVLEAFKGEALRAPETPPEPAPEPAEPKAAAPRQRPAPKTTKPGAAHRRPKKRS